MAQVHHTLLTLVKDWNTDPRRAAQQPLQTIGKVKHAIQPLARAELSSAGLPSPATSPREHFRRPGPDRRQLQHDDQFGRSPSTLMTITTRTSLPDAPFKARAHVPPGISACLAPHAFPAGHIGPAELRRDPLASRLLNVPKPAPRRITNVAVSVPLQGI
jgi:hypothetical protein